MIHCVIGATRGTGLMVAHRLVAAGERVRVVARDVGKAAELHPNAYEIISGDVCDRASLDRALSGNLGAIYFTADVTGGIGGRGLLGSKRRIRSVTYDGVINAVDVARMNGFAGPFVLASVIGNDRRSLMWWMLNLAKPGLKANVADREQYLMASGLRYLLLR